MYWEIVLHVLIRPSLVGDMTQVYSMHSLTRKFRQVFAFDLQISTLHRQKMLVFTVQSRKEKNYFVRKFGCLNER